MTTSTHPFVVVTGGRSAERDRSLLSGESVHQSLARQGIPHSVIDAADPGFCERVRDAEFAFLAIAGQWAEDGKLQGLLEYLGVSYTGSGVLASAVAMHKPTAKRVAAAAGIRVLPDIALSSLSEAGGPAEAARECARRLGLPVIVKPASEGGSVGITVMRDRAALTRFFRETTGPHGPAHEWIIEPFVKGTAVTCGVIEQDEKDVALPPLETVPTTADFYDYRAKRDPAGHQYRCPADLPGDAATLIPATAIRAHRALSCSGYSRSDFIVSPDGEAAWLECNTLPGLSPHGNLATMAAAAGISYDELIGAIIATAHPGNYRP